MKLGKLGLWAGLPVLASVFVLGLRAGRRSASAMSAVPPNAFMVVELDVRAWAGSPFADLVSKDVLDVASVETICGFQPLARTGSIALFIPEEPGDFGLATSTDMGARALAECAEKVLTHRGGKPRVVVGDASYIVVSDEQHPNLPSFAFKDGGPQIVARGGALRAMVETVRSGSSAEGTGVHRAVGRRIASFPLRATVSLPEAWRERHRSELARSAGLAGAASSAILDVASAGLGVGLGNPATVRLELDCDHAPSCTALAAQLHRSLVRWRSNLGLRLIGLGPLLESASVASDHTTLTATASSPAEPVARALRHVLDTPGTAGGALPDSRNQGSQAPDTPDASDTSEEERPVDASVDRSYEGGDGRQNP